MNHTTNSLALWKLFHRLCNAQSCECFAPIIKNGKPRQHRIANTPFILSKAADRKINKVKSMWCTFCPVTVCFKILPLLYFLCMCLCAVSQMTLCHIPVWCCCQLQIIPSVEKQNGDNKLWCLTLSLARVLRLSSHAKTSITQMTEQRGLKILVTGKMRICRAMQTQQHNTQGASRPPISRWQRLKGGQKGKCQPKRGWKSLSV